MERKTTTRLSDETLNELILDAIKGDVDATLELFAHERIILRNSAIWGHQSVSVSDLVQETLLISFKNLDKLRAHNILAFRAWMMEILRNQIRQRWRSNHQLKRNATFACDLHDNDIVDSAPLPEDLAMLKEKELQLSRLLGTLTDVQRHVLALHKEGLSQKLIAEELGLSLNSVENHLRQTRNKLRGLLDDSINA